jgi:RES domain-containing protein
VGDRLAAAVRRAGTAAVAGVFYRHQSLRWSGLSASAAGGRWGPPGGFPVLYLGRPRESIVAEAYRHLVDPVEGMSAELVGPRRLLVVEVALSRVLDLRKDSALEAVGLDPEALRGPHARCQAVGSAAEEVGLEGVIAPAATGLGETLAVFADRLAEGRTPRVVSEEIWLRLPPDPRTGTER